MKILYCIPAIILAFIIASAAQAQTGLSLFDTGSTPQQALSEQDVAGQAGWTKIAEGKKPGSFKGAAVLANTKLAVVLRPKAAAIEVYTLANGAAKLRATIIPLAGSTAAAITSLKATANEADGVTIVAVAQGGTVTCSLPPGQPILKTTGGSGVTALRVQAPSRLGILPDFFADDMVIDAVGLPVEKTDIPSENFFLNMLAGGNAIVATIWDKSKEDVALTFSGEGDRRLIAHADMTYAGGSIWIAVLEEKGIWHTMDLTPKMKATPLEWAIPFEAKWKGNFMRSDMTIDSWTFAYTPAKKRRRWSGVVGGFSLPAWIENGKASIERPHPKFKGADFQGPFTVYPIERKDKTPIEKLTIVDLMRNSLGIGPCEQITDIAAQGAKDKGIYTCSVEAVLPGIFDMKMNKHERVYLNKMCSAVVVFVTAISDRINAYVDFNKDMLKYLGEQKQAQPEHAETLAKMEAMLKPIGTKKKNNGAAVAKLAEKIRRQIDADIVTIDYHGLAKKTASIGLSGDNHVARCRLAVKNLRRYATIEMAKNPKFMELGKEIRKRTHAILGNPLGHEMM